MLGSNACWLQLCRTLLALAANKQTNKTIMHQP
jgi:hypothetical protein